MGGAPLRSVQAASLDGAKVVHWAPMKCWRSLQYFRNVQPQGSLIRVYFVCVTHHHD